MQDLDNRCSSVGLHCSSSLRESILRLVRSSSQITETNCNVLEAVDNRTHPLLFISTFQSLQICMKVVEFGCGTGLNTVKSLNPRLADQINSAPALDASRFTLHASNEMISIADSLISTDDHETVKAMKFTEYNVFSSPGERIEGKFDVAVIVLSKPVLSHFPRTAKIVLQLIGFLVVNDMHAYMGRQLQVKFSDEVITTETPIMTRYPPSYIQEACFQKGGKKKSDLENELPINKENF